MNKKLLLMIIIFFNCCLIIGKNNLQKIQPTQFFDVEEKKESSDPLILPKNEKIKKRDKVKNFTKKLFNKAKGMFKKDSQKIQENEMRLEEKFFNDYIKEENQDQKKFYKIQSLIILFSEKKIDYNIIELKKILKNLQKEVFEEERNNTKQSIKQTPSIINKQKENECILLFINKNKIPYNHISNIWDECKISISAYAQKNPDFLKQNNLSLISQCEENLLLIFLNFMKKNHIKEDFSDILKVLNLNEDQEGIINSFLQKKDNKAYFYQTFEFLFFEIFFNKYKNLKTIDVFYDFIFGNVKDNFLKNILNFSTKKQLKILLSILNEIFEEYKIKELDDHHQMTLKNNHIQEQKDSSEYNSHDFQQDCLQSIPYRDSTF